MSIFEAGMMVCFGASWPIAAYMRYYSQSTGQYGLGILVIYFEHTISAY